MNKTQVRIIGIIFILVGIGGGILCYMYYRFTDSFLSRAVSTSGTITSVSKEVRDIKGGQEDCYHPVVSFTIGNGQTITFQPTDLACISDPSQYQIHQTVSVLYDPQNPQLATINSQNMWILDEAVWFVSLGFFILGILFLISIRGRSQKDIECLKHYGIAVDARFIEVKLVGTFMHGYRWYLIQGSKMLDALRPDVNFSTPRAWQISVEAINPVSNTTEQFKSDRVWSSIDPTSMITSPIKVYIDPQKPKHYYVDVVLSEKPQT